jgi:regulator of replication initiation timing
VELAEQQSAVVKNKSKIEMEIEELSQNIQRLLGILHQIHAENDTLKNEVQCLRAENTALKGEIEHLVDLLRRQEYEMRSASAIHDDKPPERMGRILPYDDKRSEIPPVRSGGGGGKKTSL